MLKEETVSDIENAKEQEDIKRLEAALFLSARFIGLKELVALTDINPIILRTLIDKLSDRYEKMNSAIQIVEKSEMWKMDVSPDYAFLINKLATGESEFTKAEQGTLAVISYKQPVKQSVVIKIRGNKAYEHIKKFIDLGLVKGKKAGHTRELELSEEFYDYFHVTKQKPESAELDEVKERIEDAESIEESEENLGREES